MLRRKPLKPGSQPMVRKVPLKPGTKRMKQRHRAIPPPTKEQQAHQDAQRADGCAFCRMLGLSFRGLQGGMSPCGPTRIHHRTIGDLHGNKQLGQDATVALGDWHHQGLLMEQLPTRALMRNRFGPSLAHHKRDFLAVIDDNLGERSTGALQAFQDARIARKRTEWNM